MKKYIAECIGTATLVLLGCGNAMLVGCDAASGSGYLLTALAFGLVIVGMAYCVGNVSGCHINPAVSLGVLLTGGMSGKDFVGYVISQIVGALVGSVADDIGSAIAEIFPGVGELGNVFKDAGNIAKQVWPAIKNVVHQGCQGIRTAVQGLAHIVGTVRNAFNQVKTAIQNPMEAAKNLVKNAINAIKGFFHFSVPTPHIPVPHFSISPAGWSVGDLLKGSIPSLSLSWYADGGFVDGATLIGAGERGPEMILPESGALMDKFSSAIASKVGGHDVNVYLQYDASTDATQMAYEIARVLNRKLAMEA